MLYGYCIEAVESSSCIVSVICHVSNELKFLEPTLNTLSKLKDFIEELDLHSNLLNFDEERKKSTGTSKPQIKSYLASTAGWIANNKPGIITQAKNISSAVRSRFAASPPKLGVNEVDLNASADFTRDEIVFQPAESISLSRLGSPIEKRSLDADLNNSINDGSSKSIDGLITFEDESKSILSVKTSDTKNETEVTSLQSIKNEDDYLVNSQYTPKTIHPKETFRFPLYFDSKRGVFEISFNFSTPSPHTSLNFYVLFKPESEPENDSLVPILDIYQKNEQGQRIIFNNMVAVANQNSNYGTFSIECFPSGVFEFCWTNLNPSSKSLLYKIGFRSKQDAVSSIFFETQLLRKSVLRIPIIVDSIQPGTPFLNYEYFTYGYEVVFGIDGICYKRDETLSGSQILFLESSSGIGGRLSLVVSGESPAVKQINSEIKPKEILPFSRSAASKSPIKGRIQLPIGRGVFFLVFDASGTLLITKNIRVSAKIVFEE